jgi:hypothetical protein
MIMSEQEILAKLHEVLAYLERIEELDEVLAYLERIEQRQIAVREEIKESAPPVTGRGKINGCERMH